MRHARGRRPARSRLPVLGSAGVGTAEVAVLLGVIALGVAAGLVLMRGVDGGARVMVLRPW